MTISTLHFEEAGYAAANWVIQNYPQLENQLGENSNVSVQNQRDGGHMVGMVIRTTNVVHRFVLNVKPPDGCKERVELVTHTERKE